MTGKSIRLYPSKDMKRCRENSSQQRLGQAESLCFWKFRKMRHVRIWNRHQLLKVGVFGTMKLLIDMGKERKLPQWFLSIG